MSLNRQETRIEAKQYAPSISFNSSVIQPVPMKEIERPDIRPSVNLNLDLGKIAESFAKADAAKADAAYNQQLNNYARKLNEIVEGQRQGAYNQNVAERLMRQTTDDYIMSGSNAMDLAKVRDKFDGGMYNIEQQRQAKIVMHEQERQLAQIDTMRKNYSYMTNWSDDKVLSQIDYLGKLQGDVDYMNQRLGSAVNATDEDISAIMVERNMSFKDLTKSNIVMMMQNIVNAPDFDYAKMDANSLTGIINRCTQAGMQNGIDYGTARMIAEESARELGLTMMVDTRSRDLLGSTEFVKKVVDNLDTTAGLAIRSSSPEAAVYMSLDQATKQYVNTFENGLGKRVADEIFNIKVTTGNDGKAVSTAYLFGQPLDDESKNKLSIGYNVLKSNLNDNTYPLGLFANSALYTARLANQATSVNPNMNNEELDITQKNIQQVLNVYGNPVYNTKANKARQSQTDTTKDIMSETDKQIAILQGKQAAADLLKNDQNIKRLASTLNNSLQSERLRIDPKTGNVVMLEDTTGVMSYLGDAFASQDTRVELNRLNEALANLDPEVKQTAVTILMGRELPPVAPGEKILDTSKETTAQAVKRNVSEVATDALRWGEQAQRNFSKSNTDLVKEAFATEAAEKADKYLDSRKAMEVDPITGKYVDPETARLSALEQQLFTDTTSADPLATLVDDRIQAAEALEAAANRLEQQDADLSQAGRKELSKGNKKAIEEARKKAQQLRQEAASKMRTSKYSNSETLVFGKRADEEPTDDVDTLNEYNRYMNSIQIPSKEAVNITVDDLPAARDNLKKKVKALRSKMKAMDDGWENLDTDKYIQLSSQIAAIERILNGE